MKAYENAGKDCEIGPERLKGSGTYGTKVEGTAKVERSLATIKTMEWSWAGHIMRRGDNRWTARVTEWIPWPYKCQRRQKTRWKDEIRALTTASDRVWWRMLGDAFVLELTSLFLPAFPSFSTLFSIPSFFFQLFPSFFPPLFFLSGLPFFFCYVLFLVFFFPSSHPSYLSTSFPFFCSFFFPPNILSSLPFFPPSFLSSLIPPQFPIFFNLS